MKVKRILAGLLGAGIILALLFFWEFWGSGDPLSVWIGGRRAVAYAAKCYPGQTFTVMTDVRPEGRIWETNIWVQSETSSDTYFGVTTRWWLFTESWQAAPHERMVEGRENTRGRLELEAGESIAALLAEQLPDLTFRWANYRGTDAVAVQLCRQPDGSIDTSPYLSSLPLDAPFTPNLLQSVPSGLRIQILWPTLPTEEDMETTLHRLKTVLEQSGFPITYYSVELIPDLSEDFEAIGAGTLTAENRLADQIP